VPEAVHPAAPRPVVAFGNFIFGHRNYLFPIVFLSVALVGRPLYPFGSSAADRWMDAAGILLAAWGQWFRMLVIALAYVTRGGKDGRVHADELVTHGIFSHSRNPLYVGNVAVFLGLFLVLNSALGWLVGAPFFLLSYASLIRAEETFLRGKFGAPYDDYCRRVPRFFPHWRGMRATVANARPLDWKRSVRKEYGPAFAWMSTAVGVLYWERVKVEGAPAVNGRAYLAAWGVVALAYGVARWLKKTRRLH
jgi:protein-S-isoprenylcysteine O-methyltransferase Ste14